MAGHGRPTPAGSSAANGRVTIPNDDAFNPIYTGWLGLGVNGSQKQKKKKKKMLICAGKKIAPGRNGNGGGIRETISAQPLSAAARHGSTAQPAAALPGAGRGPDGPDSPGVDGESVFQRFHPHPIN